MEDKKETTLDDVLGAIQELTKSITELIKETKSFRTVYEKNQKAGKF